MVFISMVTVLLLFSSWAIWKLQMLEISYNSKYPQVKCEDLWRDYDKNLFFDVPRQGRHGKIIINYDKYPGLVKLKEAAFKEHAINEI